MLGFKHDIGVFRCVVCGRILPYNMKAKTVDNNSNIHCANSEAGICFECNTIEDNRAKAIIEAIRRNKKVILKNH